MALAQSKTSQVGNGQPLVRDPMPSWASLVAAFFPWAKLTRHATPLVPPQSSTWCMCILSCLPLAKASGSAAAAAQPRQEIPPRLPRFAARDVGLCTIAHPERRSPRLLLPPGQMRTWGMFGCPTKVDARGILPLTPCTLLTIVNPLASAFLLSPNIRERFSKILHHGGYKFSTVPINPISQYFVLAISLRTCVILKLPELKLSKCTFLSTFQGKKLDFPFPHPLLCIG